MGSPIETWEGAAAIFNGAGGAAPVIWLVLAGVACFGAIVLAAIHEEHVYAKYLKK
ncbi:MAG: hypothetical protein ACFB13_19855 [Kiloniellaceae bacterium]